MTKTYFIPENEDVIEFFEKQGISISYALKQKLKIISIKNSNNYIGYYQFMVDDSFWKIYILPKTINQNEIQSEKEEKFLHLLKQYYSIKYKYSDVKNQIPIEGNIIDYSIEIFNKLSTGVTLDNFIEYKYEEALNNLERFFRKHRRKEKRYISYHSQSISNNLDLKKNVASLDKSNIYQIKREEFAYSKIAIISERILKYFLFYKTPSIFSDKNKMITTQKSKTLINKLNKSFELDKSFGFSTPEIISNNVLKNFKKTSELRNVHESLLILAGLEHFNCGDLNIDSFKLENMTSIFFRPEKIYEWIVYDYLISKNANAKILKDGFGKGTSKEFNILRNGINVSTNESNPDFILETPTEIIIVDAKWKILSTSPDFNDISKLRRDEIIRQNYYSKPLKSILIFPRIFWTEYQNPIDKFNYDFESDFGFSLLEIKVHDHNI